MKGQIILLLLAWIWVLLFSCSSFEEGKPIIPDDTTTVSLPFLKLAVADTGSGIIKLDSIIAADEVYTLTFGVLKFGRIVLENAGRTVRYVSSAKGWKIDSTDYEICRKGRCRKGIFRVTNVNFKVDSVVNPEDSVIVPEDTIINPGDTNASQLPNLGPVYVESFGSADVSVSQLGFNGKFISIKHSYYTTNIQGADSSSILYFAGGGGTVGNFGFDDVFYTIKTTGGEIKKGKIEFIIGDTCEAQARNNSFTLTGNSSQWQASVWFENDKPCSFTENQFKLRLKLNPYGLPYSMATEAGIVTDAVSIGNQQYFKYKRTNTSGNTDTFFYYLQAGSNNRISRARILLKFN